MKRQAPSSLDIVAWVPSWDGAIPLPPGMKMEEVEARPMPTLALALTVQGV